MITLLDNRNVENPEDHVIVLKKFYTKEILKKVHKKSISDLNCLAVGISYALDKRKYGLQEELIGSMAVVTTRKYKLKLSRKEKTLEIECESGDVLIFGTIFRQKWNFEIPNSSYKFYELLLTSSFNIFEKRLSYANDVKKELEKIMENPKWKENFRETMKLKLIGKGSYANVFTSCLMIPFALKISKTSPGTSENYNKNQFSWHELFFLKEILKPMIEKGICPNFPLFYDYFTSANCMLSLDDKTINTTCIVIATELASGNLKDYFRKTRTEEEIYSCLFQVFAAVYAIQYHAQIMNYDVKKENFLFYNIKPGGYWKYKIMGKNYYVPNLGTLFVMNDFGLARPMTPKYEIYKNETDEYFRLGKRYAVIDQNDIFIPIDTMGEKNFTVKWKNGQKSTGIEMKLSRKTKRIIKHEIKLPEEIALYLQKRDCSTNSKALNFFYHPDIIPPFEFFNDTQDCIRMFIGGKRTTQEGSHSKVKNFPVSIEKNLSIYNSPIKSSKENEFSFNPAEVCAGYFIKNFFPNYREIPNGEIISSFVISN